MMHAEAAPGSATDSADVPPSAVNAMLATTGLAAAVEVDALHFAYGRGRPVFAGLSWTGERGAFVGLLGPNGSGKSTLLHLLAGILRPTAGTVRVESADVAVLPAPLRAQRIALVAQDNAVPFDFSVRAVVEMGRYPFHGRFSPLSVAEHALIDRCMEMLDVAAFASTPVRKLSGGERQRVAIARALAQTPRILLLDEPTASLDIRHVADVARILRALNVELGVTLVVVMHDLNLAATVCPTVALLDAGRIVAQGPVAEVLAPERLSAVYRLPVTSIEIAGQRVIRPDYGGAMPLPDDLKASWPADSTAGKGGR